MKKIRSEKVMAHVGDYLKRRNLESSGQAGSTLSEQQVGVLGLVTPSAPNTFTFSTTSTQYTHVDHQYVRLKSWMMEASEPCRSELSQVLFPLFVHLYLELVTATGRQAANRFFKRHYQVFLVNRDYENTLSQVVSASGINTSGDVNSSPVIQNLKSGKYLVRLSELTLNYFLRYLKSSENSTLLQIFNSYIEVEVDDSGAGSSVATFRGADMPSALVNGHTPDSLSSDNSAYAADGLDCTADELRKVRDAISRVRQAAPTTPSLCLYTVANAYNGLSCARVNGEGQLLACGFEDSVVKLWKLTPPDVSSGRTEATVGPRGGISHCLLACDDSRIEDDSDVKPEDDKGEDALHELRGRRRNTGGEVFALRGHSGPVFDVAFTHDSEYLLSVSEDCTMRLWELGGGQAVALYRGHQYPVWALAVAPLTMYVATGSYDTTARLWTTEATYPLRTLAGHTRAVDCVDFHPNGSYIATGSCDRSIRLWQVTDGETARILLHHKTPINTLSFSPNGKYLASGSEDGTVCVWDLAGGRVLSEISSSSSQGSSGSPHQDAVVDVCWSKDSSLLVSASSDGCVRASHFKEAAGSDVNSWDLNEVGNVQCGNGGGTLVHTSLTSHNYLTSVMAQDVER